MFLQSHLTCTCTWQAHTQAHTETQIQHLKILCKSEEISVKNRWGFSCNTFRHNVWQNSNIVSVTLSVELTDPAKIDQMNINFVISLLVSSNDVMPGWVNLKMLTMPVFPYGICSAWFLRRGEGFENPNQQQWRKGADVVEYAWGWKEKVIGGSLFLHLSMPTHYPSVTRHSTGKCQFPNGKHLPYCLDGSKRVIYSLIWK